MKRDNVGIIIDAHTLTLCLFNFDTSIKKACCTHKLTYVINNFIIINMGYLGHVITQFLHNHKILQPYLTLVFAGPALYEHYGRQTVPDTSLAHYALDSVEITPGFFYTAGLLRPLLFQYQLLAYNLEITLNIMTTATIAHYYSLDASCIANINSLKEFHEYCKDATLETIIQGLSRYEKNV